MQIVDFLKRLLIWSDVKWRQQRNEDQTTWCSGYIFIHSGVNNVLLTKLKSLYSTYAISYNLVDFLLRVEITLVWLDAHKSLQVFGCDEV
jgi:hypothetical protein